MPANTVPPGGIGPPRPSRSSVTTPAASSTASAPGPGSVTEPNSSSKRMSSLASVQVKSCFGRSVGSSPPLPPQLRMRPGARLRPSSSRRAPSSATTSWLVVSASMNAASPVPSGSTRLVRPLTASDTSAPSSTDTPARSPSVPSASPITK